MNDLTGVVEVITSKPAKTIMLGSVLAGVVVAASGIGNIIDKHILSYALGLDAKLSTRELAKRGAVLGAIFGAPFAYLSAAGIVYGENTNGLGIAQSGKFRVLNSSNRLTDYPQRPDLSREPTAPADYTWAENSRGDSYLIVDPKYKL